MTTFALLFVLAYGLVYGLGLLRVFQDKEGRGFMLAYATATISGALLILWFLSRRNDPPSLRIDAQHVSGLATDPHLRRHLAADAFTLAILLARLGSERLLQRKQLPDNLEVITRRRHLEQLRKLGLWDALPLHTRDLLLAPDGHWLPDTLKEWHCFETLRCLRWVLRLDADLTPIAHLPRLSGQPVHALIASPDKLLHTQGMQDIWDIRLERIAADRFFSRCFVELRGRGLLPTVPDPDDSEWMDTLYEKTRQRDHRDLLVTHHTIAELNEDTLRYIASVAWNRYHTLQHVMDLMEQPLSNSDWQAWTRFCFPEPRR